MTGESTGVYVCHVTNFRTTITTKALLRVVGLIPKFNGDAYVVMHTMRDSYSRFNLEIAIKPESKFLLLGITEIIFVSHNKKLKLSASSVDIFDWLVCMVTALLLWVLPQ